MNQRLDQHHLSTSISIDVEFTDGIKAKTALKALTPDNINFPDGLTMRMFCNGAFLSIELESNSVPMVTVISTLDEVLEHIAVTIKLLENNA